MKWNWGTGIATAIILFVLIWGGLIIFTLTQKVDLVTPNYYEEELKYQKEIDRQSNSLSLSAKPVVSQTGESILVKFPIHEVESPITGELIMYRVSDSKSDRRYSVSPDSTGFLIIPSANLARGLWRLKIQWKAGETAYSTEEKISL